MKRLRIATALFVGLSLVLSACVHTPASIAQAGIYKPGTYTAKVMGHNGYIDVDVSFNKTAITDIKVVKDFETAGVSDKALRTVLPQRIIDEQSLSVDSISGATFSSRALISAVEKCATQAGANTAALWKPRANTEPGEIEKSADVVIIGGGGAGLAAAVAANDLGASVIIVEKEGYVGGNTMVSGGIYNAPDPAMQSRVKMTAGIEAQIESALAEKPVNAEHAALMALVKKEYEDYKASGSTSLFDSPDWFALQTWISGDKIGNLTLVKMMANDSLDSLHWLMSKGYEIKPDIVQGAGSLYQRTHSSVRKLGIGIITAYTTTLAQRPNVEIIYDTAAKHIVMKDGRVVGVKATDKNGNLYTFTARKNVILSTGGFAGNPTMLQKYNTSGKWPDLSKMKSTNLPAMKGDGIVMAEEIGAALRNMDQIQLLQTCSPKTGNATHAYVAPIEAKGYLFLNKEGKRFVREDGRRDQISLAALAQTDGMFYMVESADVISDPAHTTDLGGVPLAELIEAKDVYTAPSLKALCELIGIPYENAKASIDSYNEAVDKNLPADDLGRELLTQKQERGPWYAIPRAPAVHHTMGGVVINTDCQVIDKNGNVIPGLYAAGEVAGGIHGGNRVGGNAIVCTVVFGRIAGTNAAK